MAKKFGKLLLISAAIGSAIGAVYYFARKKDAERDSAEDDYDDFSEEDEKEKDSDSRSYVPLNPEGQADEKESAAPAQEEAPADSNYAAQGTSDASAGQDSFTPLAEQVADTAQKAEESVEEFFDEEDSTDEEPPISDN